MGRPFKFLQQPEQTEKPKTPEDIAADIAARFWRSVRSRDWGSLLNAEQYEHELAAKIIEPIAAAMNDVELVKQELTKASARHAVVRKQLDAIKRLARDAPDTLLAHVLELSSTSKTKPLMTRAIHQKNETGGAIDGDGTTQALVR